jgi:hypothetical protein
VAIEILEVRRHDEEAMIERAKPMQRTNRRVGLGSSLAMLAACGSPAAPPSGAETGTTEASTAEASTGSSTQGGASTAESSGSPTSTSSTTMVADDSSGSTTGGGEIELRGACPLAESVGGFSVAMEPEYSSFAGAVADGVVPVSVLEQVGAEGDCILLRRNNPFCDPLCLPGQTCDYSGTCIPYPVNHDVGVVAVSGLVQPVMVEPVAPTYSYFDTSLPHPACEPGADIELTAEGGDYVPFVLHGRGVPRVEPTAEVLSLSTGRAVNVEWVSTGSDARLQLVLNVDQHGLAPVRLVCESDDTGSLSISPVLVSQFLAFGVSGYPSADYYLQTADSVDLAPGCVEFLVRSHQQTLLDVEGHTPCDAPADCPMGQMCDVMIQTCV